MKTKKVWANLPAKDVEGIRAFYSALDFRVNGDGGDRNELASFLVGDDDFVVHFFKEKRFKESVNSEIADLKKGNEVMFTLSADSREEVNEWAKEVKKAGGTVFSEPQAIINDKWYGCGFADPEGHKWNVFYNGK